MPKAASGDAASPTAERPKAARTVADSLRPFLRLRKDEISVGEMLDRVEQADGPGPVLFILTLPVMIPLPPGVSMIVALPLLLVAPQIAFGRKAIWLPKALLKRTIKREALIKLIKRLLPTLERVEKVVRPRLGFLTGRVGAGIVGGACTLVALVLVLPIPFANLVPSMAMVAFSVGLTRKDGVFVLAGYSLIALAAGVIALGVHGFTFGFSYLRTLI